MSEHARLAPSASGHWRYCAGYLAMVEASRRKGDTPESIEGNAAHWAFESNAVAGQVAPSGYVITDEMIKYVRVYQEYIEGLKASHPDAVSFCERRVTMGHVGPDCWGTVDYYIYVPSLKLLYVIDFKYGWGIVEIKNNPQVLLYTLGIINGRLSKVDHIVNVIVQPRAHHPDGPIREVDVLEDELVLFLREMQAAAQAATRINPIAVAGRHCKNCEAIYHCPANKAAGDSILDFTERATPENMDNENLGEHLDILEAKAEILNARVKGIKSEAEARAENGANVLGYVMDHGKSSRAWTIPVEQLEILGDMLDIKLTKKVPLSPAQAETAGLSKSIVEANTKRLRGAMKLKRGSVKQLAERIFKRE